MKDLIKKYNYVPIILLGTFILAFGMYNIHARTAITEGGILGMELLLDHWFGISPGISALFLDGICYLMGIYRFGKPFLIKSIIGTCSYSLFYNLLSLFPPMLPYLGNHLFIAAIIGACFIGVGAGLVVREGGAAAGDDALALVISDKFKIKMSTAYLLTDLSVLALTLTYVPFNELVYSFMTVILSGKIIDIVVNINVNGKKE